jgi:flagellum-specific ATP synthase
VLRDNLDSHPDCRAAMTRRAPGVIALHAEMADLVRSGAYRAGSNEAVDEAIRLMPRLDQTLTQGRNEHVDFAASFATLRQALEYNHAA